MQGGFHRAEECVRGTCVEDFVSMQPGATGKAHRISHVVELSHGVGIDGEDERDPSRPCCARPLRLDVQAIRIAVDLDRASRLGERVEHLLHPQGNGRP